MKRLLLAAFLLVVVVAVSWVKTVWDDHRAEKRVDREAAKLRAVTGNLRTTLDSLRLALSLNQQQLDSLTSCLQPAELAGMLDSINAVIDSQEARIATLNDSLADAQQRLVTIRAAVKKKTFSLNHSDALRYFKKKSAQLPHDLTTYERRVALNELKHETAGKFSLSAEQIDTLIKEAGLSQ